MKVTSENYWCLNDFILDLYSVLIGRTHPVPTCNIANDDTDDAKGTTTNELELSSSADEGDIEQDSYGYESVAQRGERKNGEIFLEDIAVFSYLGADIIHP